MVLTVPMRNGNPFYLSMVRPLAEVLTVPMRNGNSIIFTVSAAPKSYVLTVPMRNGNIITPPPNKIDIVPRSYRTYEEWKHIADIHFIVGQMRSYRTYEEWKLRNTPFLPWYSTFGSYRTYEEWKQSVWRQTI